MKSTVWERISKMLSAEGKEDLSRQMLDVLRVLVVYSGSSWKSELVQELPLLRAFRGEPGVAGGRIEEALGRLEKEGLVRVEKRVRADMGASSGVEDELITLLDLSATRSAMAKDRVLSSYTRE
jgi:hypothetical protein